MKTTDKQIEELKLVIYFLLERLAYIPRYDSDETYTFNKVELKKELLALIQQERDRAVLEALDALYWMYIQYCSGGHDFMGAGEGASELLENAGYIKVDSAGRIVKRYGDSTERAEIRAKLNKDEEIDV